MNEAADVIVAIKTSKTLKVIVKPNSLNSELIGYSDEKKSVADKHKSSCRKRQSEQGTPKLPQENNRQTVSNKKRGSQPGENTEFATTLAISS